MIRACRWVRTCSNTTKMLWFRHGLAYTSLFLTRSQEAFKMAHGVAAYEYYVKDSACISLMQRAMSGVSVPFMRALLESYDGFGSKGLKTVVDVGGSTGSCLAMILERHRCGIGLLIDTA
ncbi:hypothetical protein EJ110_NYTH03557 [Nymphaea thermarum]|nr:hypothetical protein EJ110_NYTH03557 [Nymphaea thermarum]